MSVEQTVVELLTVALAPADVRYGIIEQHDNRTPPESPYVIIQRIGSNFPTETLCDMGEDLAQVIVQIDAYAERAADARVLCDNVRAAMATMEIPPSLDSEIDFYEPGTRLWRVAATYTLWDYSPNIVIATGRAYSSAYSSAFG